MMALVAATSLASPFCIGAGSGPPSLFCRLGTVQDLALSRVLKVFFCICSIHGDALVYQSGLEGHDICVYIGLLLAVDPGL
jgi:hypothetical protein